MRIAFLTQDDPLYILPFFEEFLRHYADDFEIKGVYCSRAMGQRDRKQLAKELLMLYKPLGFVRLLARSATARVLSTLPRPRNASRFFGLKQLCESYGVPYSRIGNPNNQDVVDTLRAHELDALVSVACPYILKAGVLSVPKRTCVNIHHAPLPLYRGMMPTFWQLYHGEQQVGVTIHTMAEKLDAGTVVLRDSLSVQSGESLDQLIGRSKRHGAHCMAKALNLVASGNYGTEPILTEKGSYFTFPTGNEIREFHRKGLVAI